MEHTTTITGIAASTTQDPIAHRATSDASRRFRRSLSDLTTVALVSWLIMVRSPF
jgi:hypothetical protein